MFTMEDKPEKSCLLVDESGCKLYKRRWIMLANFGLFMTTNFFMWVQYAAISDVVAEHYDVSTNTVDLLNSTYSIAYIVFIVPVMLITERFGLRTIMIGGTSLQCVGSWFRFVGTSQNSLLLHFIGQSMCGAAHPCVYGMGSQVAGTWFGIEEVSFASALGFIGIEVGFGIGYILPKYFVQGPDIGHQMKYYFLFTAIVMTILMLITAFVFEGKPPLPPSKPRMNVKKAGKKDNYLQSIKFILSNKNFLLLLVTFGTVTGFSSTLGLVLNEFLSLTYADGSTILSHVGIAKILCGISGPLISGIWLDRSKYFRVTTIVFSILCAIVVLLFAISLAYANQLLTTISMVMYVLCITSFFVVAAEHAVEQTYPESEIMSSGILITTSYVVALLLMFTIDVILSDQTVFFKACFCFLIHIISVITSVCITGNNRRQDADNNNYQEENNSSDIKLMESTLD
ncbi:choline/ethanolamine transporter flvcr2a-like [Antedon mediterranea]|uniref:choline/ethanolamine transporter flvcr2a-like n=1 Tax=Antedon mediterranea TaxID=105859 RepID=UPI003AF9C8E3